MSLFNLFKNDYPFGLDISDLSIKLIALEKKNFSSFRIKNKNRPIIASYNQMKVPPDYFENGEIKKTDQIVFLIKKTISEAQGKKIVTPYVVSILPETKTFLKLIEIPATNEENIAQLINNEIKNHIPLALEDIYLDWQIAPESDNKLKRAETIKVLVAVAPQQIVDEYTELLIKAGLKPVALEVESAAISRCLIEQNFELSADFASLIIDFGAARTSLIIYDKGTIQFTSSIPFSGESITQTIANKLKISNEQAEKSKLVCGLDPKRCKGVLKQLIIQNINEAIVKIDHSINFYKDNFPGGNEVKKILLCGGGAKFTGLDQVIAEGLGKKVDIADPLINLSGNLNRQSDSLLQKPSKHQDFIGIHPKELSTYTTAIGLALRGALITN